MADQDDRRLAASIAVGIAGGVTTACIAVLGALAAIVTFVVDKYEGRVSFWLLISLAALCLIAAVFLGAHGTAEIVRGGHAGRWRWRTDKGLFNYQALVASLGIALLVAGAAAGLGAPRRSAKADREQLAVDRQIATALGVLARETAHRHRVDDRLRILERRVKRLARKSSSR